MSVTRRGFLAISIGSGAAVAAGLPISRARASQPEQSDANVAWSPVTSYADARAVVGASHSDLDAVRALVSRRPTLALATVDWGFGDFESALGAASHVGRADIAEYLIENGARPDLFALAMLGNLAGVRAALESNPALARLKGPHGFTLAHHARVGGERAAAVAEYLATIAGADEPAISQPIADSTAFCGTYRFVGGAVGSFSIAEGRRAIEFRLEGASNRNLIHVGGLEFHPVGAPGVRLRFTPDQGGVRATLELGDRTLEAVRAE